MWEALKAYERHSRNATVSPWARDAQPALLVLGVDPAGVRQRVEQRGAAAADANSAPIGDATAPYGFGHISPPEWTRRLAATTTLVTVGWRSEEVSELLLGLVAVSNREEIQTMEF